jgi:hypothetical protein
LLEIDDRIVYAIRDAVVKAFPDKRNILSVKRKDLENPDRYHVYRFDLPESEFVGIWDEKEKRLIVE